MKISDLIIALFLAGLSIFVFYETSSYPRSVVEGTPSPALFPNILAGALLILSLVLFVQQVVAYRKYGKQKTTEKVNWTALGKVGTTFLIILLFLIFIETVDFFILYALLILFAMLLMGERNLKILIIIPIGLCLFIYGVFYKLFGIDVPTFYF